MRPGSILSTTNQTKQTKNGEAEKSEKRSYRAVKWAQPGCLHELHWGRRSSTERSVPTLSTLETKVSRGRSLLQRHLSCSEPEWRRRIRTKPLNQSSERSRKSTPHHPAALAADAEDSVGRVLPSMCSTSGPPRGAPASTAQHVPDGQVSKPGKITRETGREQTPAQDCEWPRPSGMEVILLGKEL